MNRLKIKLDPQAIFGEYQAADMYKQSIGKRGINEQAKVNERFFIGDHWHGAKCGDTRPLVRRNIIKRIGEFKLSAITASPIAVNFTAEGVPTASEDTNDMSEAVQITAAMRAFSDYFKVTAERLRLDHLKEKALKNAYISGTGLLYTYWDPSVKTGQYADSFKTLPIKGDIGCEVLDIENVFFAEPNNEEIQNQPYIIVSRRRYLDDCIREAKANGLSDEQIALIKPDSDHNTVGEKEPEDSRRVTTLTKFYKQWENGEFKIMCTECTEKVTLRPPFDIGIKLYPFAIIPWERRRASIYGESEITYLVPNQIAINRCLTAAVWSLISTGMPITVVNGDIVTQPITNEPGQMIRVYGSAEEVNSAIHYIEPPAVQSQYFLNINQMASTTLSDSGANDVALGNLRPDNAAAIIEMREAALQPLQMYMNRFYDFIEQLARIWAEFWINLYGKRALKTISRKGISYTPFDGELYKNLIINAHIDVGAATLWSEAVVISTLDSLLERELITFEQYLERLPSGLVPDSTGLREDLINKTLGENNIEEYEGDI